MRNCYSLISQSERIFKQAFPTLYLRLFNLIKSSINFLSKSNFIRFLTALLALTVFLPLIIIGFFPELRPTDSEVFVGVMVGFADVDEIKDFVDEVEDYVNLIIVSDLNVTTISSSLYSIFDYLSARGIYFIPFMRYLEVVDDPNFFQVAKQRWGKHFLGVYTFDEPGGKQIDLAPHRPVDDAQNYSEAASKFTDAVAREGLLRFAENFNMTGNFTIFTSDYALYWFDYTSCYNVVFSQFGWNYSSQLHASLCRGAATGHNSDWGAIVTWTYRNPPYLESPEKLYDDMILAYNNGAKYITVFNFPTNITKYGLLTEEHLESLQKFWKYTKENTQPENPAEVAYVLPADYGYGFRGPNDKIWGLWGPDELSSKIWNDVNALLDSYGSKLDIIYETADSRIRQRYDMLFFWNETEVRYT
jgi:hypothetical protein